ncbi:MAG: GNAT family N-acetyltransferase [Ktedonobacterales bacterium]
MTSRQLVHRAYDGDLDLYRLLDALSKVHAGPSVTALMHPGDLVWALFQNVDVDPYRAIEIWESTDGDLVGFGLFEESDFDSQCFTHEDETRLAFEQEVLAMARERARQMGASALRTAIPASDALRRELLESEGFASDVARVTQRGEPHTAMLQLSQSLGDAAGQETPTTDFVVRQVGNEEEWPERVDLHRTVWAPSRVTLPAYYRLRAAPIYRPDLDLVAVTPKGTFAAYAIAWYDPDSHVGEFEPVGTHPNFRRQGAARLVMLEGLRRLRKLGAQRALVTSSAHNPASIRLYESVGFGIADRVQYYRAQL